MGGVFNGYSFVAGDYLVRDSIHGDFAMAKATFETTYGGVGIPDDAGFNQYVYTNTVGVVNQGGGNYQVTEGTIVKVEPTVEFNQNVQQIL